MCVPGQTMEMVQLQLPLCAAQAFLDCRPTPSLFP